MFPRLTFSLLLSFLPATGLYAGNHSFDNQRAFASLISKLVTKKFDEKEFLITRIAASRHERSLPILQSLLEGRLYYKKDDKTIVIARIVKKNANIIRAIDGRDLGQTTKKKIRKVGINNRLRRVLNIAIARLNIADPDPAVRKAAVVEMLKVADQTTSAMLKDRLAIEKDKDIIDVMQTAIAVDQLNSSVHNDRLNAINSLSSSLYPEVRVALTSLQKNLSDTPPTAETTQLLAALEKALNKIQSSVGIYKQIENIFLGLSLGSVLLLIAVGLAITFGVMGVINMAHGEMLMLGAYTTYIIQQLMPDSIEYSVLLSIPVAFIFTGLVGIGIERGVIRFLYGRPLETLLATFGISLILQQAVRTIISPQNRAVSTPDWMSGSLEINPALALTYNRMYIIIFALLVLAGLMLLLHKSRFGLQVRAVTQNRPMAKAMGIRTDWIDAFTFGLGSGIAGIAGVALSQLTNVGPNLGQTYIIDSFMVVVFGGVGNLWGTFFAAMTLGVANKYLEPFSGAVLAKILVLVFIILFIQKKPRGMFALKGRSAES